MDGKYSISRARLFAYSVSIPLVAVITLTTFHSLYDRSPSIEADEINQSHNQEYAESYSIIPSKKRTPRTEDSAVALSAEAGTPLEYDGLTVSITDINPGVTNIEESCMLISIANNRKDDYHFDSGHIKMTSGDDQGAGIMHTAMPDPSSSTLPAEVLTPGMTRNSEMCFLIPKSETMGISLFINDINEDQTSKMEWSFNSDKHVIDHYPNPEVTTYEPKNPTF